MALHDEECKSPWPVIQQLFINKIIIKVILSSHSSYHHLSSNNQCNEILSSMLAQLVFILRALTSCILTLATMVSQTKLKQKPHCKQTIVSYRHNHVTMPVHNNCNEYLHSIPSQLSEISVLSLSLPELWFWRQLLPPQVHQEPWLPPAWLQMELDPWPWLEQPLACSPCPSRSCSLLSAPTGSWLQHQSQPGMGGGGGGGGGGGSEIV